LIDGAIQHLAGQVDPSCVHVHADGKSGHPLAAFEYQTPPARNLF
jgi:hypothetical protein